ncbi:gliding motility-associated C-terminal domain-containing protein [Aquimarina sp. AU58]|uniref:T9SS type B sorting domain-containing protein n=1 Tax=Aquimarina sp. AU58 TaxID=1874112 RepID=UPI000D6E6501|nr:gliding motility-associated C-terminal domain-containing protein [Aquimarina sp. AU58]
MRNSRIQFTRKLEFSIKVFTFCLMVLGNVFMSYSQGCPDVPISILDGTNGLVIEGLNSQDDLGYSVKDAGDLNRDGIADIIIGAPFVDGVVEDVGEAYVIFGESGISLTSFDLTTLDGTNGFVIRGTNQNDRLGRSVSRAGDFNDDGFDDIIIGVISSTGLGKAIIIYGTNSGFLPLYLESNINGTNGIIIESDVIATQFGNSVSYAGDINDDGKDDVVINAPLYDGGFRNSGRSYVIFGNSSINSMSVSVLNGMNGFVLEGLTQNDSGYETKVSDAGDINGDGFDDIILGFPRYDEGGTRDAGRICVIYGNNIGFSASIDLSSLNGSNGFSILGEEEGAALGFSVSTAEDFNNDGVKDFIAGAPRKDVNTLRDIGEAYVVYGKNVFPSSFRISDLNNTNSVTIRGDEGYEPFIGSGYNNLGYAVDGLNDVNNDGITDIIVSATGGGAGHQGGAYILFGSNSHSGVIEADDIDGVIGYQVFEDTRFSRQRFGYSVSTLGDFNDDGASDFVVGAIRRYTSATTNGRAYVFYGETFDLIDTELPTISCPSNQELYSNSVLPNYVSFLIDTNDNCTYQGELTFTQNPPQGTIITSDTNVTVFVTDKSGNTNSCNFLVTIKTTTSTIECNTASFPVSDLNGNNGIVVYGEMAMGRAGGGENLDVDTAGDVNGDGIQDFIIGATGTDTAFDGPYNNERMTMDGSAYVVFGTNSGFPPNIDLALLDGTNGFVIRNDTPFTSQPATGASVSSAGDVNGDGVDDIMVSDPFRKTALGSELGYTYIIFGRRSGFLREFLISTLDGNNGFTIIGVDPFERPGYALDNIGDFNGDNIDDIALLEGSGSGSALTGKCHILYGTRSAFPPVIRVNEINGRNGFTIVGDNVTAGKIGYHVSGLGDVNGDNINDVIIGGRKDRKFVVFGSDSPFPVTLNVSSLDGANGFAVEHSSERLSGLVGSIGDINGDSFNDMTFSGQYVLFGSVGFPAVVDLALLDGTNGFSFDGSSITNCEYAGDFNNDGIDDAILSQRNSVSLLYGKNNWESTITLTSPSVSVLPIRLDLGSRRNISVSHAGDVNNDDIDDIIIGTNDVTFRFDIDAPAPTIFVIFGQNIPDIDAPNIRTCPGNQTLSSGSPLPDYTGDVDATDDCDTNLEITQDPIAGTLFTADTTVTITVTDNSGKETQCSFDVRTPTLTPTVNLSVSSNTGTEADETIITVRATSSMAVVGDQTIDIGVTGVEITSSDFTLSTTTITIPDGMTMGAVTFTIVDDTVMEGIETAIVTISNPSTGITLGRTTTQNVVITDNDSESTPTVNLSASSNTGTEADETIITVRATSSMAVVGAQTIDIAVTGTGITPSDFTLSNSTITIPDGMTTGIVTFTIVDDIDIEGTETATLTISNPSIGIALGRTTTQNIVIIDNDSAPIPTVNLSVSANAGTEAAGTVITATATSSIAVVGDQTIDIAAAGAEITPSDFTLSNSTITIPDGMTTGIVTFTIVDDALVEGTETAIVTISNPSIGIALGRTTTQNIVIIDNDSAPIPTVNLSVSANAGTEAAGTVITATATSSIAVVGDQTIDIAAAGAEITPSDFTLSNSTITIPDGVTTGIVTFTIVDDALVEGTETATLTISNPSTGITLGTTTTQDVVIEDNDDLIICTIEAGDDEEIIQGQEVQLNATASGNGTFVWTPSIGLTNTNIANPIANPDQTTTYTVLFTSDQGCIEEDTVTVYVEAQEEDQTRYGFSPDGDGINEYWEIHNIENYPNNKVSIYNRWGDIVFEVEGYNNTSRVFRGIANRKRSLGGDKLPEGTYFFNIKIEGSHNLKKQTGFLVLKR